MHGNSGSPARAEHGAAGVHDDGVHAVTRLDDAPAHFLDDACLHAPAYDIGMPELPELEALVEALDPLVTRAPVRDVPVAHFAVVKTATPPLDWLAGHSFTGAVRRGKHLLFPTDEDLVLTVHLMTAGKLAYVEPGAKRPPGPRARRALRRRRRARRQRARHAQVGARPAAARRRARRRSSRGSAPSRSIRRSTTPRSRRRSRAAGNCTRCCATSARSSASAAPMPTRSCTPRSSRRSRRADRLSPEERARLLEAIRPR